jgi:hypothetical protein
MLQFRRSTRSLIVVLFITNAGFADSPARRPQIKGELQTQDGLRILRVWGTPREQGFAQGYLLGEDGVKLLDKYLNAGGPDAIKAYEVASFLMTRTMKIEPRYQQEMEGIVAGFKARLGDKIVVPVLGRPLEYRDLIAVNCIPETARVGCSSFAVWGPMTADGGTLAGRNLDWYHNPALDDSQILVARVSEVRDPAASWVSLTWPCFVGCLTGMNAEGVTVSVHDAPGQRTTDGSRLTPRGLALRESLESARAATAGQDIAAVLRRRTCMVGNNIPVALPFVGKGYGSIVFEYDGDVEKDNGVTIRTVESDQSKACLQACTNHYRKRADAISCDRYENLEDDFASATKSGKKLDVAGAFAWLDGVAMSGHCMTYHSVVFEPNSRRMHIRLSQGTVDATHSKPIVIDVAALLRPAQ